MTSGKNQRPFFNRELSWLEFNRRVLSEARDASLPALERLKFLAITASNLDEFFMVRVGGLQLLHKSGSRRPDLSGQTPRMQLKEIRRLVLEMNREQATCYRKEIEPLLAEGGLHRLRMEALTFEQDDILTRLFNEEIFPAWTPVALTDKAGRPFFRNLQPTLLIRLAPETPDGEDRYAVLPLGDPFNRQIDLPAGNGRGFVLIEDLVRRELPRWFPGTEIRECALFRITKNADLAVREEESADLLAGMLSILEERNWSDCVRIEIEADASPVMRDHLCRMLDCTAEQVYRIQGPLDLSSFMNLTRMDGFEALCAPDWTPQPCPRIDPRKLMFDQIAERDILLYHPYEAFDPVIRLIREAAADPAVLAIKQVLYRTASDSPIVQALKDAAGAGKAVTVLVELKARFDEQRNIVRARDLEQAGVQVVYGVQGLKTHAKACLILRREPHGIVRYVHTGTGNYNETTARLYGDISLMSCDEDLGQDISVFFHAVCGYAQPSGLRKAVMAPLGLRSRLIELIDGEIERCKKGHKALILLKMNSLVDESLIRKLYEASCAGVEIRLNVRGICCLQPGVPGQSPTITVTSIVGRYLEHARIFYFHRGGDEAVFLASADWMPRNLDRRVELMIPVEERGAKKQLIRILKKHMADTVKSWTLLPDGRYVQTSLLPETKKRIDSQAFFQEQATDAVRERSQASRTVLRPHRPPSRGE